MAKGLSRILSKLKQDTTETRFVDIIANLGPNLKHLSLTDFALDPSQLAEASEHLSKNPTVANQLIQLTLQRVPPKNAKSEVTAIVLDFIVNHFVALTHLDICVHPELCLDGKLPSFV